MKQSEIQEIITATPDAVFYSTAKYNGDFIITGFVKGLPRTNKYGNPVVMAEIKRVFINSTEGTTHISETTQTMPLRLVSGSLYDSVADYTASKVLSYQRAIAARKHKEQQAELMTDLMPELRDALKQAGVDNKAFNFGTTNTTFKIEVDVDNAEQLLQILRTFHTANA
jgi:hypothetical protein